jgi:catechol 2,3-dioxygenase-like lactoylglutathione lyase family enzyme
MRMIPIIYVADMDASIDFYEGLDAVVGETGRAPYWTEMKMGGTHFALHLQPPDSEDSAPRISIAANRPLEAIMDDLTAVGVEVVRGIGDEVFGRSMVIKDLDGLIIQINERAGRVGAG